MPSRNPTRFDRLDAWRGFAMVWMTVFHLFFDLNDFRFISQNFYTDPFWTWQRTLIVALFLSCAGFSQAVANHLGQTWPQFWRRWLHIVGCAVLVSVASYWKFPGSFIYFGVLHGIAVMLLLARLLHLAGLGWRSLSVLPGLLFAAKSMAMHAHAHWTSLDFFNEKAWSILGFVSRKPITEDFVPLLPWLGVVLVGMALGQWVLAHRLQWLSAPVGVGAGALAALGRHSLVYYMAHQPVMIGALMAWRACLG